MRKKWENIEELKQAAEEWMEWLPTATVKVEVAKPDKFGGCIVQTKPEPPLIESFCRYVRVSDDTFLEWINGNGTYADYKPIAREIRDFCIALLLKYQQLGYISDASAKFYAINNSRYKDVKEIITENTTKVLPAWATGSTIEIEEAKPKALPHESIEFVDMSPTPIQIEKDKDYDFL